MTKLVGIVNLTPDSFSDGGRLTSKDLVLNHCKHLIESGASVLDVGAESTRPNASPITHELEWQRLAEYIHDIAKLCHANNITLSVDTRHAKTAEKAIKAGAGWINDVSGASSPDMIKAVADGGVYLVIMHSLTVPANPAITMQCNDVVSDISKWAGKTLELLNTSGIATDKIIFDPGVGFGKTAEQSMEIINRIAEFKGLGLPIMVGHSRKSFLKLLDGDNRNGRGVREPLSPCGRVEESKQSVARIGEGEKFTVPIPLTKSADSHSSCRFDSPARGECKDAKTAIISRQLIKSGVDYIRVHAANKISIL